MLHAHMPYVEGYGEGPDGEAWLWEALASVYMPLLDIVAGEAVTIGFTPVLADQLETLPGAGGERFVAYLDASEELHAAEAAQLARAGQAGAAKELRRAGAARAAARATFLALERDVLGAWARATAAGRPAAMTSSTTHAVLPLIDSAAARRLQLDPGIRSHRRRFGGWNGAFWLPECGYAPGIEDELAACGVRAFCVEQTGVHGLGAFEQLEPVQTAAGPIAVPIDWETVALVWDGRSGYPTAGAHRDHHTRKTERGLRGWSYGGEPYVHAQAVALAREQAADFVRRVRDRLRRYRDARGRPGLVCCALDAELVGHWWHEGTTWLAGVLSEAREQGLALVTLPEAMHAIDPVARPLAASTWSPSRDLETWDSPLLAPLRRATRGAEAAVAEALAGAGEHPPPALARAARELLALQASDWAFQITHGWAGDYPVRRWRAHEAGVRRALRLAACGGGEGDDGRLRNLAPDLDLTAFTASA